jgi:uncharacterized protein YraI
MRRSIYLAIALALAGTSTLAAAGEGFAAGTTTLYAGPDASYPPIDTVPAGARLFVEGCTDGYAWCDVIAGEDRGWIAGDFIQYDYNNQTVFLSGYGAAIGIPIVTFAIADYWGHYYRNRPFFAQREHWFGRPLPQRPPPVFRGVPHDYVRGPVREAPGHPFAHAPVLQGPPVHHDVPVFRGMAPHAEPHREAPHEEHREEHGH